MKNQNKILAIGLDGATFNLIQPWVKKGLLPNIANLMVRVKFMKWEVVIEGGDSD